MAPLDAGDLLAAAHLAVVVTALAFVLWYTAVARLGADRAGLFTGVVPVTAAVGGVLLGAPIPAPVVWTGMALVAAGLVVGLAYRRAGAPLARESATSSAANATFGALMFGDPESVTFAPAISCRLARTKCGLARTKSRLADA